MLHITLRKTSSHRRHSRQQRAPMSIVDHGCWHFATPNVVIYLKSLVPSFHLFLQVLGILSHLPSTATAKLPHVLSNRSHHLLHGNSLTVSFPETRLRYRGFLNSFYLVW